jgi:hypothetical protein
MIALCFEQAPFNASIVSSAKSIQCNRVSSRPGLCIGESFVSESDACRPLVAQ